ncbi:MAG TPA: hypothetical protein VN428_12635 [Bryobacteraceae bacterium]|nr:hypothetical protein [Bryobacteraceae bacterium]
MSDIAPVPSTSLTLAEPRWQLVQRVADSLLFRKGPKLRAFLLYVCENAILGRHENLTAQLIGTRVFGRSPQSDMSEDNIVRVEARELRKRLEAYFAGEGREEPVIIEIPKGSYLPVFRHREPAAATAEPESVATPVPGDLPAVRANRGRFLIPGLVLALTISSGVLAWLAVQHWRAGRISAEYDCYTDLLGNLGTAPDREMLLVLSNPGVVMYYGSETEEAAGIAARRTSAPEELKRTFGFALRETDRTLPYHYLYVSREDFTGIGEAVAAYELGRLFQTLHRANRATQSRFLNWGQVQKQDLVLLGGPSSNDWSYQDDARSNFQFVRGGIANGKPLPGELKFYPNEPSTAPPTARFEYGLMKMLTSPYGFKTLLLAGVSSAGTAGVAEFFASPRNMTGVAAQIRSAAAGKPFSSDWEVLVRIAVRGGLPVETSVVAVRPAPSVPAPATQR